MPLSFYALDNFVSQELSQLTECRAIGVADEFSDSQSWLTDFVLNRMLGFSLPQGEGSVGVHYNSEVRSSDY